MRMTSFLRDEFEIRRIYGRGWRDRDGGPEGSEFHYEVSLLSTPCNRGSPTTKERLKKDRNKMVLCSEMENSTRNSKKKLKNKRRKETRLHRNREKSRSFSARRLT